MRLIKRNALPVIVLSLVGLVGACNSKTQEQIEYQQSYDSGKAFYEDECQKCHQEKGQGLAMLYPPLDSSDYLKANEQQLACIIYKGLKGPILVNGKKYDWAMPPHPKMDEIQMSSILTYIQNTWGVSKGRVDFKAARAMMNGCGK